MIANEGQRYVVNVRGPSKAKDLFADRRLRLKAKLKFCDKKEKKGRNSKNFKVIHLLYTLAWCFFSKNSWNFVAKRYFYDQPTIAGILWPKGSFMINQQ